MVTFRVKLRFHTRRKLSALDRVQGHPRLARIGGRVNRNLPHRKPVIARRLSSA
jgi:hypothetical protein